MEVIQQALNWISLFAMIAMAYGVFLQLQHTQKTRSRKDILTTEVTLRTGITAILFIKLLTTRDPYLIAGQALLLIVLIRYLVTLRTINHS